ncbi:hypothetical protein GEMRC1_004662 [Eukaryota sp. GEM-RC1]
MYSYTVDLLALVLAICVFALLVAWGLARSVLNKSSGPAEMKKVGLAIQNGAKGYLSTQYSTIAKFGVVFAILIGLAWYFRSSVGADNLTSLERAVVNALSFAFGCACSAFSGYIGMFVSVRANLRTANAARFSLLSALVTCLRAGAFAGILVVALSLLGVGGLYSIVYYLFKDRVDHIDDLASLLVAYGFGASFVALFSQLGGGIFTKAADCGADIVGKIYAEIPEDDPRNPAVIADLVGDNVGDCAGRGADLFESTAAEMIGSMILGGSLCFATGIEHPAKYILFPLVIRGFGLIASIIGVFTVRNKSADRFPLTSDVEPDPTKILNRGFLVSSFFSLIGIWASCWWLLSTDIAPSAWWKFGLCGTVGLLCAYSFVLSTTYFTDYLYKPVKSIAEASKTGHASNIIQGVAVGFESVLIPVISISISIITSYWLGKESGLKHGDEKVAGIFGTAVAVMGMLSPAAYVLAMDVFGPISDNAGGIVEMSGCSEEIRARTDRLDAVGNSTKAVTKGYAVGSGALAVFFVV